MLRTKSGYLAYFKKQEGKRFLNFMLRFLYKCVDSFK